VKIWTKIGARGVAWIITKVAGTGGGLALAGVNTWTALGCAAWVGALEYAEEVSKQYLNDGQITEEELNRSARKLVSRHEEQKKTK
jgi:hypothetical protein